MATFPLTQEDQTTMNQASEGRLARLYPAVAGLAGAAIVVALMWNRFYAKSGDLAAHYDLARYLSQHWLLPGLGGQPLPSGMQIYPPLAHYLAAVVGTAFGSTLIGLNVVSVLAVFVCYFLLARAVSVGSAFGAGWALLVAVVGLSLAREQYAIEGFQVYYSFFYAHMVGEAVFFAYVYWASQTSRNWTIRLLVAAVATYVGCWLYSLASIELALGYISLEGFLLLRRIWQVRRLELRWMLPTAAGAVLPVLVVLNPAFHTMIGISQNDGALDLRSLNHLTPVLAVALLMLSGTTAVFAPDTSRWRRGTLFLAVAGAALATGLLMQFAMLRFWGLGSDYAIKKYAFGVVTVLIFSLGGALATLFELHLRRPASSMALVWVAAAFAVGATLLAPVHSSERLDKLIPYERAIVSASASKAFPRDGVGNTVSLNPAFGWYLNHALTVSDLQLDSSKMVASMLADVDPDRARPEQYAFVPESSAPKACVTLHVAYENIVLASLPCIRATLPPIALGQTVDFVNRTKAPPYFVSGWSVVEPTGMWSGAKSALMAMHFANPPPLITLTFVGLPFLPHPGYVQHVRVDVDGRNVGNWAFDTAAQQRNTLTVPASMLHDGDLRLNFTFPDATSPAEQKLSADARTLAYFVNSFTVSGS